MQRPGTDRVASTSWRRDLRNAACGLMMGGADIIPGVSGGTVALILGIYARLVTAISRFDAHLLRMLLARQWRAAFARIDARFLTGLGTGIAIGIIGLAKLMRYVLEHYHLQTMAVFFGLILGSSLLVGRRIKLPRAAGAWTLWMAGAIAAVSAFWLVGLPLLAPRNETASLGYVFVCGVIAICAMILPGVSGAYFLLVMGLYFHITDIIHRITQFEATSRDWSTAFVFALGCGTGLIGFSKIVRWLLVRFEMLTMATLCGLMLGSLRKVWPFQVDTTLDAEFRHKIFKSVMPEEFSVDVWIAAGLVAASAAAVLLLERAASRGALPSAATAGRSLESHPE